MRDRIKDKQDEIVEQTGVTWDETEDEEAYREYQEYLSLRNGQKQR